MKKIYLTQHGVVTQGKQMVGRKPKPGPMKQDDQLFLDALDALMEKHTDILVDKLVARLGAIPVAMTTGSSTMVQRYQAASEELPSIEIDDSTFVVDQKLDGVKKGFDELAEKKTTKDAEASKSISKLRNLKKGKN
jgi:hypothetical protein